MLLKLFFQIAFPSPKVWDFDDKMLHWASVVRGTMVYGTFPNFSKVKFGCPKQSKNLEKCLVLLASL